MSLPSKLSRPAARASVPRGAWLVAQSNLGRSRGRPFLHRTGPVDVEDMHQPFFQLMYTENDGSNFALKGFRWPLKRLLSDLDHVANFIDQQADSVLPRSHDHIHRDLVRRTLGKLQTPPQVHGDDDLPAQIHEPTNDKWCQRNFGQLEVPDDFLDFQKLDAEKKIVQIKRAELLWMSHDSVAHPGRLFFVFHG